MCNSLGLIRTIGPAAKSAVDQIQVSNVRRFTIVTMQLIDAIGKLPQKKAVVPSLIPSSCSCKLWSWKMRQRMPGKAVEGDSRNRENYEDSQDRQHYLNAVSAIVVREFHSRRVRYGKYRTQIELELVEYVRTIVVGASLDS